mgnify:CR=1 FL=1
MKLPKTNEVWGREILLAYKDAEETKPFAELLGSEVKDSDFYLLAPDVCLKFRKLPQNEENKEKATEAAFSTVVATESQFGKLDTFVKFALAYLASHLGLDILEEDIVMEIMDYIDDNADLLKSALKS